MCRRELHLAASADMLMHDLSTPLDSVDIAQYTLRRPLRGEGWYDSER